MTDKPIIFSGPMVRALLEGRKTQTRRVLKPQPGFRGGVGDESDPTAWGWEDEYGDHVPVTAIRLPYAPGDRLWVRETWTHFGDAVWSVMDARMRGPGELVYRADEDSPGAVWFPSIHMPREFSRLTLVVTDVRVQRVQEISEEDAMAEGCNPVRWAMQTPRDHFEELWDSINAKRGYGWDANPWVAALTFTVHKANIDRMGDES